jgi:hypothetical protein
MMNAVIEGVHLSWKGGKDNQGDKTIAFLPFFHIYVRHISPPSPSSPQLTPNPRASQYSSTNPCT